MRPGLAPSVDALLSAHGVSGREGPIAHNGFSGARITIIERDAERWFLKRQRYDDDWIMRATGDTDAREAAFAASSLPARLPAGITVATLGAARDGDGTALLMRDVAPWLLPDDGILSDAQTESVLGATALLHETFEGDALDPAISFTMIESRLRLLSPATGKMLVDEGRDFGIARGWEVFANLADPRAVDLARRLFDDMAPLVRAMEALPSTLVHGDLRCANLAIEPGGAVCMLDWAVVSNCPATIDLVWLLAVNSSRFASPPAAVLDVYIALRAPAARDAARWERERAVIMLCGLVMYGWGKALDAEAGMDDEFRWWCDGAIEAAAVLDA